MRSGCREALRVADRRAKLAPSVLDPARIRLVALLLEDRLPDRVLHRRERLPAVPAAIEPVVRLDLRTADPDLLGQRLGDAAREQLRPHARPHQLVGLCVGREIVPVPLFRAAEDPRLELSYLRVELGGGDPDSEVLLRLLLRRDRLDEALEELVPERRGLEEIG